MTKQVTKRCRRPIGHLGCNRLSANEINTSVDVPPASVQRNHNSRTTRATVLGFAPNVRPRLVCSVSETPTHTGIAFGFSRYYFRFALREGLANSRAVSLTCLFSWSWAAGIGLVARLLVGVLECLAALAVHRIVAVSRRATTRVSSRCMMMPGVPVAVALDGRITSTSRWAPTRASSTYTGGAVAAGVHRHSQARPAAGGLADAGRIAAPTWTATAGTASPAPTPRPAADVAAAADCTHGAVRVIAADGLGDLDGRLSPLTEFHNQCPQHVGAFQIKGARYDRSQ